MVAYRPQGRGASRPGWLRRARSSSCGGPRSGPRRRRSERALRRHSNGRRDRRWPPWPSVAAAAALWAWWSSARVEEPGPLASESRAVGLLPFMPSWADLRASETTPAPSVPSGAAATAPTPRDPRPVTRVPPPAAPLPGPVAPPAVAPTLSAPASTTNSPAGTAGARVPPVPADPAPGSTGGPGNRATTPVRSEPLYYWSSPGVQPPVLQYPGMASWAMLSPEAVITGPYFEVLVDLDGNVETVRIRRPDRARRDVLPPSHDAGGGEAVALHAGPAQRPAGALRDPRRHRRALAGRALNASGTSTRTCSARTPSRQPIFLP